jgi:hypothetical protein
MEKTYYTCGICGFCISDRLRHPGWISLEIHNLTISIPNKQYPELPAFRTKPDGKKDFCSRSCLLKWVNRIV